MSEACCKDNHVATIRVVVHTMMAVVFSEVLYYVVVRMTTEEFREWPDEEAAAHKTAEKVLD